MSYISRSNALAALSNMRSFYVEALDLYRKWGLSLSEDLGRRNVLLSSAQEKFFARALRESGLEVRDDGRTGQSDIAVELPGGVRREIECKLTTRNSAGGVVLQTDYTTLEKKGELDYLYVIAGEEFDSFAVLLFESLNTSHFRVPSATSRGKAGMLKHSCFDRCHTLVGSYACVNDRHIQALEEQLRGDIRPKKREALERRLGFWQADPGRFEVGLELVAPCGILRVDAAQQEMRHEVQQPTLLSARRNSRDTQHIDSPAGPQ